MTMVHIATKSISRKAGQSAVACAAYRAGDILDDIKYGKTHDYSKKSGVMSSDIVLPFSLKALGVSVDRETLWNTAEAAESRSDSRVAREWLINLPYELSEEERHSLAISFAQKLCDDMDVIADVCIHRPVMKLPFDPEAKPSSKRLREGEENPDPRNFHAHILVTTRAPIAGPNKTLTFDSNLKTPFEWSNKKRLAHDLPSSMQEIKRVRQMWVDTANVVLAEYHLPLMDARSYQNQGRDQQPTIKMGVEATAMERRGIITEKGNINRAIKARNNLVVENHIKQEADNERRIRELRSGLTWATEKNARLPGSIGGTKQRADFAKQLSGSSEHHITYCTGQSNRTADRVDDTKRCIDRAKSGIAWATDHSENLSKWINGNTTRGSNTAQANDKLTQRIDDTKQAIKGSTEAIGKSDIEINAAAERSARSAPSPFDDNYRRAFYERERRINKELREQDRQAHRESYADEKDNNDLRATLSVFAHRLMTRHNKKFSLRPGYRDNPADYPEKFDYRQVKTLDRFANKLGLTDNFDDFREEQRRIADLFTFDVMQDNLNAMDILINRQKERKNYNEVTADFDTFITELDTNRAAKNKELQDSLGRSDISRMTAETVTAVSYLENIEQYINNTATADECKILAEERIKAALTRTSTQYELAFQGLKTLDSNESAQKHTRALESSLSEFTTKYANKLTDSDMRSINEGLKVINQDVEVTKPINRPSPF